MMKTNPYQPLEQISFTKYRLFYIHFQSIETIYKIIAHLRLEGAKVFKNIFYRINFTK